MSSVLPGLRPSRCQSWGTQEPRDTGEATTRAEPSPPPATRSLTQTSQVRKGLAQPGAPSPGLTERVSETGEAPGISQAENKTVSKTSHCLGYPPMHVPLQTELQLRNTGSWRPGRHPCASIPQAENTQPRQTTKKEQEKYILEKEQQVQNLSHQGQMDLD